MTASNGLVAAPFTGVQVAPPLRIESELESISADEISIAPVVGRTIPAAVATIRGSST
jgi:hypothetical protein